MNWLWTFLIDTLPLEIQLVLLVAIAAGVLYVLGRILGWERVRAWILPVLGVIGALGLAGKIRQGGRRSRIEEEEKALEKAEVIVDEKRDEIETLPDDQLDHRLDKWTKP